MCFDFIFTCFFSFCCSQHHISGLDYSIHQMLPLAAAHLGVQGKQGLGDELWTRHNARAAKHLELAKAVSQQLGELQTLLQKEVDDLVHVFAQ